MAEIDAQSRRNFLRVQTHLGITFKVVPPEETERVRSEVMSQSPARGELESEVERLWHSDDLGARIEEQFAQLTRYLNQVDAKLDYLIALAEDRDADLPQTETGHLADISGGGVGFLSQRELELGTMLDLHVILSRFPLMEIRCMGTVVRSEVASDPDEGYYDIGCEFDTIHQEDRERIFRFVSRVERRMLRDRKEDRNP